MVSSIFHTLMCFIQEPFPFFLILQPVIKASTDTLKFRIICLVIVRIRWILLKNGTHPFFILLPICLNLGLRHFSLLIQEGLSRRLANIDRLSLSLITKLSRQPFTEEILLATLCQLRGGQTAIFEPNCMRTLLIYKFRCIIMIEFSWIWWSTFLDF